MTISHSETSMLRKCGGQKKEQKMYKFLHPFLAECEIQAPPPTLRTVMQEVYAILECTILAHQQCFCMRHTVSLLGALKILGKMQTTRLNDHNLKPLEQFPPNLKG